MGIRSGFSLAKTAFHLSREVMLSLGIISLIIIIWRILKNSSRLTAFVRCGNCRNMAGHSYLSFDLGAESGRTIFGHLEKNRLTLKEVTRFPNRMLANQGHLYWDVHQLFEEIKKGIKECVQQGHMPDSLGIDTWGVDFGLLDKKGKLLSLPFAYRDPKNEGAMEEFFQFVTRERVYALTGTQFLQFNSLFQLNALKRDQSPLLPQVSDLLFMPDLFNFLMTGKKATEFTLATTSQLYNPLKKNWEGELFDVLNLPTSIMQVIVPPGTKISNLKKSVGHETGIGEIPVIAVASHDTASAVASVPAEDKNWAFISSGTWSCMGIEIQRPIINDMALELNFTNEGGVDGTFRFLKNIMGLWLLQECRRIWAKNKLYSYKTLMDAAETAPAFQAILEPDWPDFLNPVDMTETIRLFCSKTDQRLPDSLASYVRSILESLALKYRFVLEQLEMIHSQPIDHIHIIGGGAKNRLLCQFAANATSRPVFAGPSEATAIGNILYQAKALGHVPSLGKIREIIRNSFPLQIYQPEHTSLWEEAYLRFQELRRSLS